MQNQPWARYTIMLSVAAILVDSDKYSSNHNIIDAIKSKHSKTQALDGISSSISPSISSPNEIIEDKITDSSE
jgi:hypothetical protein